jgi:osmoprotectant transport system permease protein
MLLCMLLLGFATAAAQTHGSAPGFFSQLWQWFAEGSRWSGEDGIPNRTIEYIGYVGISMLVSLVIALPVGIGLVHTGRGGLLAINVANIGRAVPAFGLVILMFLLVGYGFIPVLVALVALAVPPMITNSYVGMRSVDPAVRQAAIAMGMTGWQQLWRVELPIALPLVMAGIRTSAVQVMSTAVLAAYIGLGGLGRYLIDGLSQQNMIEVFGGAILVAILAVITEYALAGLQRCIVSKGLVD